tara:strand:+ start:3017 stop:4123 length:1107 start_codon:yes stop_codon:yes gene_type:complete
VYEIAAGNEHVCAVVGQNIKCWGHNLNGQLGYGDKIDRSKPPTQNVSVGTFVSKVSAGRASSCAILANGQIKCWGFNNTGMLGYNDRMERTSPPSTSVAVGSTAKTLSVGSGHMCAVLSNDRIKCWGSNTYGELGYASAGILGYLQPPASYVTTGFSVQTVHTSSSYTCVLLTNGQSKCWGSGLAGKLGYGDTTTRKVPDSKYISLGTGLSVKQITQGSIHVCVLLNNNKVKCWGHNSSGQLGYGDTSQRLSPPSAFVDLGAGRTATYIAAGESHTCVILDNGQVKCWGKNASGELGYGDTTNRNKPASATVSIGTGRRAIQLSLGVGFTCALLDNHEVKCWGNNQYGQLGYGDKTNRTKPATSVISF